jgi:integrase
MLNDMYIAMMRDDTVSGKPSSGSYVNQIHDNITLVFEAAKARGNPYPEPLRQGGPAQDGHACQEGDPTRPGARLH